MSATKTAEVEKAHRWPLWTLLVFAGGISLTLSVIHAFGKVKDGDGAGAVVALLAGIAPVIVAACLSHLLTDPYASGKLKLGVVLVFGGAMLLSVNAQAEEVEQIFGAGLSIVFPLVLDLSTMVGLLALAGVGYSYQQEVRKAELRAELRPEVEAELQRKFAVELASREREIGEELEGKYGEELASREEELRREIEARFGEELAAREQEIREELLHRVRAAEDEIRRRAEAEIEQRVQDAVIAAEARVRLELTQSSGSAKRTSKAIDPPSKRTDDQANGGLNKRDRAASILRSDPEITPKDLAAMVDCSTKYARMLIAELAPGRGNGQEETPESEVHLRAVQ